VKGIINQPFANKSIGKPDVRSYNPEQWDRARIELGELISQGKRYKQ
jgi:hypothetical protein